MPDVIFDHKRAAKALRIFKRLRLVDVTGQPTMGEACDQWVFDFVKAIFGAVDPATKRQLIRQFFLLIAKKNTKSTIAAGIMLTALILNERGQAEYLILAPTKEIADNSFIPAYGMVKADAALLARYKPSDTTREIIDRLDGSALMVKAADADVVGGSKSVAVFVDELWLFGKKASAENVMSEVAGSLVSRPEGFVIYASTQSDEPPVGVFKSKLDYFRDVRDGLFIDKASLPLIYEYPQAMVKAGAYNDQSTWYIPNPNLNRSVDPIWLTEKLYQTKRESAAAYLLILTKHFNLQAGGALRADRWPGVEFWAKGVDPSLTVDEVIKRSEIIVVGVDGGGLDDLFGLTILGRERNGILVDVVEDGTPVKQIVKRWLSVSRAWCHRGVAWEHNGVPARRPKLATILGEFETEGSLTVVDDSLHDISEIIAIIKKVRDSGLLYCVAVDPAGIGDLVDALAAIEITQDNKESGSNFLMGVAQGYSLMNALKTCERRLANGTLLHGPELVMNWAVENLKIEPTATAIRATKQNAGDLKIDPAMALFDAAAVMTTSPEVQVSVYDQMDDEDAQTDDESAQVDDIDMTILADPEHPQWQIMRERYEAKLATVDPGEF